MIASRYRFLLSFLFTTVVMAQPSDCRVEVDPYKELMIVDPLVVEDARANPGGPWHFSSLLRQMLPADATETDVSDFTVRWLKSSKATTPINGFNLEFPGLALGEMTVCGWLGVNCEVTPDPSLAPYRLIGIVNRLDLNGHGVDYAEGRFVFAGLSRPTRNPISDTAVIQFPETVIFEYRLPLNTPQDLLSWATAWHQLADPGLNCTTQQNCEPFRKALESITSRFSSRNLVPGRPNGNPLGQLRTSHSAPGANTLWAFRQFELSGTGKMVNLVSVPVSQTPHGAIDDSPELVDFVKGNAAAIRTGNFVVPKKFWGAEAVIDDSKPVQWRLTGVEETVRSAFAGETCNGCHAEKKTVDGFFHLSPTESGRDRISDFLKQDELPRRAGLMKALLCAEQGGGSR